MLRGRGRACPARGVRGRGLAWAVCREGFIPPGRLAAAEGCGASGTPPPTTMGLYTVSRKRATPQGCGGVRAPRPTDGVYVSAVGAAYMPPAGLRGQPFPGRRAVGAGHARPGGWRGRRFAGLFVGRGLDPSAGGCPGAGGGGRSPLIRPCGATFPRGGRQGVVGEGFIPPGVFAATRTPSGRRGRRPLRFAREHAEMQRVHILTPAAGPRCGAGGSGCSTSGLTKPALYRRNPGRCRGGSRR